MGYADVHKLGSWPVRLARALYQESLHAGEFLARSVKGSLIAGGLAHIGVPPTSAARLFGAAGPRQTLSRLLPPGAELTGCASTRGIAFAGAWSAGYALSEQAVDYA
jgi:hypothetical protein